MSFNFQVSIFKQIINLVDLDKSLKITPANGQTWMSFTNSILNFLKVKRTLLQVVSYARAVCV